MVEVRFFTFTCIADVTTKQGEHFKIQNFEMTPLKNKAPVFQHPSRSGNAAIVLSLIARS
jgi:hypothetical protein